MTKALLAVIVLGVALAAAPDKEKDAAVALAKKTLAAKLGVAADALQLDKAEEYDFPDTSLGCPEKGMTYAQIIMSGYKVLLKADGKPHAVHVAGPRAVICATPQPKK